MAVTKRGKAYFLRIRPFGRQEIGVKTSAKSKREAKGIEMAVLSACRFGDFRSLDSAAREVCVRMYRNQQWEIPLDLLSRETRPHKELVLWDGVRKFLTYPGIKTCRERKRYEQCFVHLLRHFEKDMPIRELWIPEIKRYMAERLSKGASPSTVNREKGCLSRMLQTLVELRLIESNPCRLVKSLSQKQEERQVYLSYQDVQGIVDRSPEWFKPFVQTAYFSGMRQGEIRGVSGRQVKLGRRLILLGPTDTKEGHWKRVPIHKQLMPVLEEIMKVRQIGTDKVFLVDGRSPNRHSISKAWSRAVKGMDLDPHPRFHDLRHCWRGNARKSGMDPTIAETIMGHWNKGRTVNDRYGLVSDEELIRAIDAMTYDHGESEILIARP